MNLYSSIQSGGITKIGKRTVPLRLDLITLDEKENYFIGIQSSNLWIARLENGLEGLFNEEIPLPDFKNANTSFLYESGAPK